MYFNFCQNYNHRHYNHLPRDSEPIDKDGGSRNLNKEEDWAPRRFYSPL